MKCKKKLLKKLKRIFLSISNQRERKMNNKFGKMNKQNKMFKRNKINNNQKIKIKKNNEKKGKNNKNNKNQKNKNCNKEVKQKVIYGQKERKEI